MIRKSSILSIENRTFKIVGIWWLGNKASKYELQEVKDGKSIGEIFKKDAKVIDQLINNGKIKVI